MSNQRHTQVSLITRITAKWSLALLVSFLGISALVALTTVNPSYAKSRADASTTPSPASPSNTPTEVRRATSTRTPRPTATPLPFYIEIPQIKTFRDYNFQEHTFNGIAVHPKGRIYVADGDQGVVMYDLLLSEIGRIPLKDAYTVSVSRRADRVYVGTHAPIDIELFTPEGDPIGSFFKQSGGILNALGVAPDDTLIVMWKSNSPPFPHFMTRLDRDGKEIFTREIAPKSVTSDGVFSVLFEQDGTMAITVAGFGVGKGTMRIRRFDANGTEILKPGRLYYSDFSVAAPAHLARTRDGRLVIFSGYGIGVWDTNAQPLAFNRDITQGQRPTGNNGLALLPDGLSFVYAESMDNGSLVIGMGRLIDRARPFPTPFIPPTYTPSITPTPTDVPTQTPIFTPSS